MVAPRASHGGSASSQPFVNTKCGACRRESNRESARRSRARKLEEIHRLEARIQELTRNWEEQGVELADARAENARLAEQLRDVTQQHAAAMQQVRGAPHGLPRLALLVRDARASLQDVAVTCVMPRHENLAWNKEHFECNMPQCTPMALKL
jgi:bZIP transcription factor